MKTNKRHERENKLTEQGSDRYGGNDTHKRIPVVDVEHSVCLLACLVRDRK